MDNRGCLHAASVLTAFLIDSFGPNSSLYIAKESPTVFKDIEKMARRARHCKKQGGALHWETLVSC